MATIFTKGKGKAWARSVEAAKKRVKDDELYLISRHGGLFRPEAAGYTREVADAGVFTGKDARGYLAAEGVSLIPINDMRDRMQAELDQLTGKIAQVWQKMQIVNHPATWHAKRPNQSQEGQ